MDTQHEAALATGTADEVATMTGRPFGPAAAVMVATGIGALVLGLFTTLNEASEGIHDFLEFSTDVGPLSGKTIFGAGAFVVAWAVLHMLWRDRSPEVRTVVTATLVLVALGLLGTFPIFFQAFASE